MIDGVCVCVCVCVCWNVLMDGMLELMSGVLLRVMSGSMREGVRD